MNWVIIILVQILLISYIIHLKKKIDLEEEEELNEFYRTCAETDAIIDRIKEKETS